MTFLELINENEIIIPLIQRDYAQGRTKEKFKAETFLEAILVGTKKGLNLDFIYGKVDSDKKTFLPLDGQQRLTTLLLIYWFASLEQKYVERLHSFTYEVRSSTTDFIHKLTQKEHWNNLSKKSVVQTIENSSWFFLSWKKDPSVQALLNMLNLIETKFQEMEIQIDELENITFEFLNLDEFDLTDELYVKMNARGKPLSDFENFKAAFSKLLTGSSEKSKLDNEWLDVFWHIGLQESSENLEKAPLLADRKYYNFFYNVTYNFYVENFDFDKNELKAKSLFTFYEKVYQMPKVLNNLVKILNALDKNEKIFIEFISKTDIGYADRARFYALSLAYIDGLDKNKKEFNNWMRVTLNLINNQRIDEAKDFKNTIISLKNLSENIQNIYSYIANEANNILSFNQRQRKEESLKSVLILKDNLWENELVKAEQHWYLNGQVGFLLDFSNNTLAEFIDYRDKFLALFDEEKIHDSNKYQTLIHRALLTFDDYLPQHRNSNKYTFCSYGTDLREKRENWRQVFNKECFKNLLNDTRALSIIINQFKFDCNEWRSYFINPNKDKKVISYAKHFQIEKNDNTIYLNRGNVGVTRWSWRRVGELYSYYLFKEEFEGKSFAFFNEEAWYWNNSSPEEERPCIIIQGLERYQIDIYFQKNKFHIDFWDRDKTELPQNIIQILENSTFKYKDTFLYKKKVDLCKRHEVVFEIENLCKELQQIEVEKED